MINSLSQLFILKKALISVLGFFFKDFLKALFYFTLKNIRTWKSTHTEMPLLVNFCHFCSFPVSGNSKKINWRTLCLPTHFVQHKSILSFLTWAATITWPFFISCLLLIAFLPSAQTSFWLAGTLHSAPPGGGCCLWCRASFRGAGNRLASVLQLRCCQTSFLNLI